VSSSNLIRWGGMAAVVAGVLSIFVNPVVVTALGFGQSFGGSLLVFRSIAAPLSGVLLLLGLVGLYARQAEATGIPGLASFLVAFFGTALAQGFVLAGLLADLGWALFGVASLQARVYPRAASILLVVGAVGTGVASALPRGEPGSFLMYAVIGADVILNAAIIWLGFNLFAKGRGEGNR
jgi:hypothetical protein